MLHLFQTPSTMAVLPSSNLGMARYFTRKRGIRGCGSQKIYTEGKGGKTEENLRRTTASTAEAPRLRRGRCRAQRKVNANQRQGGQRGELGRSLPAAGRQAAPLPKIQDRARVANREIGVPRRGTA